VHNFECMQRAGVRGHFIIHRYCPCQRAMNLQIALKPASCIHCLSLILFKLRYKPERTKELFFYLSSLLAAALLSFVLIVCRLCGVRDTLFAKFWLRVGWCDLAMCVAVKRWHWCHSTLVCLNIFHYPTCLR